MSEFYESSPKLRANTIRGKGFEKAYPFDTCPVGMSFAVPGDAFSLKNLRSYVVRMGHRYNKKFKVVYHDDQGVYEVGCIADNVTEVSSGEPDPNPSFNTFKGNLPQGWGMNIEKEIEE